MNFYGSEGVYLVIAIVIVTSAIVYLIAKNVD